MANTKAITDAPNFRGADAQNCCGCAFFQKIEGTDDGMCQTYQMEVCCDNVCDSFEAQAQPDPAEQMAEAVSDAIEQALNPDAEKTFVAYGSSVKALGDGKLGGYLVRFSDEKTPDLTGDYFTNKTDLGEPNKYPVLYHHGLDAKMGRKRIGTASAKVDNVGLWVETQLAMRDEYEQQIYALANNGKLGWSSGAASHTVERKSNGKAAHITQWYIAEASLTPTPAEPRNQVVALKSLLVESQKPEASAKGDADHVTAQADEANENKNIKTQEVNKMEKKVPDFEIGENIIAKPEEVPADIKALEEKVMKQLGVVSKDIAELKAAPAINAGAPAIKKVTTLGFKDDEMKSFLHWVRTGDDVPYKAAMQGQTDSEGGYAVPDDFYSQVVAKRNEVSIARQMGVTVVPTGLDRILVPVEDTAATKFVVTAEEGAYSENEPTLNQVAITIHKMTKLIKMSEELEVDAKANFGAYLSGVWGRALGLAENYYFFNVAANGSSQPQSATYASTATTAVASQTAFTAAELLDLIYAVPSAYSDNLALVMRRSVLGKIRSLSGNPFSFIPTPSGTGDANTSAGMAGYVHNVPVYCTDELPAQAAANKPVIVLNPSFYAIAEREGLTVARNPWLYQANGQIGFFAKVREGGAALQAEAIYHLLSKT